MANPNSSKDYRRKKNFLIFTPEQVRGMAGLNLYAIYPDYWGQDIKRQVTFTDMDGKSLKYKAKHNWGETPVLGYVRETSEYWAEQASYIAGLFPVNFTFRPKAVLMKTKISDLERVMNQGWRKPVRKPHPSTVKK